MILSVIDPLGKHGGHHYYVNALATALQRAGGEMHAYVTDQTGVSGQESYHAEVCFHRLYGPESALKRGLRYAAGLWRAVRRAKKAGSALVHLHAFHYGAMDAAAVWLPRLFGMKVVITLHDIESFGKAGSKRMQRFTLSGAAGYIVHNAFSRDVFTAAWPVGQRKVAVIPHGNYIHDYPNPPARKDARAQLDLPQDKKILLFFGNSRLEKGLDLLIEASATLTDRDDWLLVIAGKMKPEQKAYYQNLIAKCGVTEHVKMDAHFISDEDTVAYYRAANLVVVPYRRVYESGVTIMTMSLARAVLVSDLPPLMASISQGDAGLSFAAENVKDLSQSLCGALDMPEAALDDIGEKGRAQVATSRDWDRIGNDTLNFFTQIISD